MTQKSPYFDRVLADCLEAMIMEGRSIPSLLDQYPEYREELAELLTVAEAAHKLPGFKLEPIPEPQPKGQPQRQPPATQSPVSEFLAWLLYLFHQFNPSLKPNLAAASWALVAMLAVGLLAGTGVGVAYAAEGSSPGDLLYGLDRATESVRLALTFDPAEKAQFGLRLAQERLAEAQTLTERNSPLRHVYQALMEYEAHVEGVAQLLSEAEGQLDDARSHAFERAMNSVRDNQEQTINLVANVVLARSNSSLARNEKGAGNGTSGPPAQPPSSSAARSAASSEPTAPGIGFIERGNHPTVGSPGFHGRLQALAAHLNQAEVEIQRGNPQAAKIALAKSNNQVRLLAQSLMNIEDEAARLGALQVLLNQAQSHRDHVLAQLLDQLPAAARAGLERALHAGGGPPEGVPGNGPPDDVPGNGPPDDVPGNGPPDEVPGNGPPEGAPGGGRGNKP